MTSITATAGNSYRSLPVSYKTAEQEVLSHSSATHPRAVIATGDVQPAGKTMDAPQHLESVTMVQAEHPLIRNAVVPDERERKMEDGALAELYVVQHQQELLDTYLESSGTETDDGDQMEQFYDSLRDYQQLSGRVGIYAAVAEHKGERVDIQV